MISAAHGNAHCPAMRNARNGRRATAATWCSTRPRTRCARVTTLHAAAANACRSCAKAAPHKTRVSTSSAKGLWKRGKAGRRSSIVTRAHAPSVPKAQLENNHGRSRGITHRNPGPTRRRRGATHHNPAAPHRSHEATHRRRRNSGRRRSHSTIRATAENLTPGIDSLPARDISKTETAERRAHMTAGMLHALDTDTGQ